MFNRFAPLVLTAAIGACVALPAMAQDKREFSSPVDKTSYAIGLQTARNLKKDNTEFSMEWLVRGLQDGTSGERPMLSEQETRQVMQTLMEDMRKKMVANKREAAVRNLKRGEDFLAANQKKEGVRTTASGLQYRVIAAGGGNKPTDDDTVLVNYRGTLLDGKQFDGTQPNRPATLKLTQMIPGMREALKAMPVGAKWQLTVPAVLAYGERGVGSDIGPNETLLFDVELVDIVKN